MILEGRESLRNSIVTVRIRRLPHTEAPLSTSLYNFGYEVGDNEK